MGGVSMEWKEVRLGDIADVQTGPFGSQLHKSDYIAEGIPCIMPTNIGPHLNFIVDGIAHVSEVDANRLSRHLTEIGDIIYARRGDIEKCAYVTTNEEKWLCGTGCLKIRCNNEVNSRFIAYLLSTAECKKWITGNAVGTTMLNLSKGILSNLPLLVPSHEDQRRIASILSSLDQKIELNNKINADLEEMAQAIFKNWFVDFEPFKDGKFVDSELGMIPEGWKVGSPYEYVKVVYGAPYKSAKFNDNGEGLPLIRIRDLKDCNPQFYTPEILPQTEYVNMGDIVAGMDAEFVPHIWKGNTGLLNQRVCKLMPQQTSISNLFVLYLMKPELEFVQSYKTGTTVSHLGKADIDKFVVVLPPLKVVEECSKILDSILQRIKNISAESRNLSTLRDTLLPRLMSGELEVPE